jgi:hypothetical protein
VYVCIQGCMFEGGGCEFIGGGEEGLIEDDDVGRAKRCTVEVGKSGSNEST